MQRMNHTRGFRIDGAQPTPRFRTPGGPAGGFDYMGDRKSVV